MPHGIPVLIKVSLSTSIFFPQSLNPMLQLSPLLFHNPHNLSSHYCTIFQSFFDFLVFKTTIEMPQGRVSDTHKRVPVAVEACKQTRTLWMNLFFWKQKFVWAWIYLKDLTFHNVVCSTVCISIVDIPHRNGKCSIYICVLNISKEIVYFRPTACNSSSAIAIPQHIKVLAYQWNWQVSNSHIFLQKLFHSFRMAVSMVEAKLLTLSPKGLAEMKVTATYISMRQFCLYSQY